MVMIRLLAVDSGVPERPVSTHDCTPLVFHYTMPAKGINRLQGKLSAVFGDNNAELSQ
jgi:hypothetical protein